MIFDLALLFLETLRGGDAYLGWFLALFSSGIGAPLSQDTLLLASAAWMRVGQLQPLPLMVVAWLALIGGDLLTFWTGRHFGARWVRRPWAARIVPPQHLPALEERVRRWGPLAAFVTRFLPGQRTTVFFLLGTFRMPYRQMVVFDAFAALVQVPLAFYGVRALGWQWQRWRGPVDKVDTLLTVALVLALIAAWQKGQPKR